MSQINMSYDTKTNKVTVTVDGQVLNNFSHLSVYRSHDAGDKQNWIEISVETAEMNEDDNVGKRVLYVSRGSAKAEAAHSTISDESMPDLVGIVGDQQLMQDVANYFSNN